MDDDIEQKKKRIYDNNNNNNNRNYISRLYMYILEERQKIMRERILGSA